LIACGHCPLMWGSSSTARCVAWVRTAFDMCLQYHCCCSWNKRAAMAAVSWYSLGKQVAQSCARRFFFWKAVAIQ
jgi:hypothetical protein